MPKPTRFGDQHIEQVLKSRRISLSEFVRSTKIPGVHVWNAVKGITPPSTDLRAIAPLLLDVPIEELFTKEALAVDKEPSRRRGPQPPCTICGRKRHTLEQSRECQAARRTDMLTAATSSA